LSISPVYNSDDQLTYYIGVQKDVTRAVEAEQRANAIEAEVLQLRQRLADLEP